jgi:hypothetical protein
LVKVAPGSFSHVAKRGLRLSEYLNAVKQCPTLNFEMPTNQVHEQQLCDLAKLCLGRKRVHLKEIEVAFDEFKDAHVQKDAIWNADDVVELLRNLTSEACPLCCLQDN